MKLRRWRVARFDTEIKGSYNSPQVRYWTYRGARAAARQLNELMSRSGMKRGMLAAFESDPGVHSWAPVRHRTLRSAQAHNIVMEMPAYRNHPANRRLHKFTDADKRGMRTIADGRRAEIVDPVQPDGDVTRAE